MDPWNGRYGEGDVKEEKVKESELMGDTCQRRNVVEKVRVR
jgi:hypothetical protein